jgi:hypothetical protein
VLEILLLLSHFSDYDQFLEPDFDLTQDTEFGDPLHRVDKQLTDRVQLVEIFSVELTN